MSERAGLGAAIGLWVGLTMFGFLILLPAFQQGSFYEIGDPMVFFGLPLIALTSAAGAVFGAVLGSRRRGARLSGPHRVIGAALGVVGCVLLVAALLWGTGLVGTPR